MNPALRDLILGTSGDPPAPPFVPTDIANLGLWLDASDAATITLDGSNNVSQWNDKSGNGRNLTQGVTTQRPSYTSGVVSFDGSDDNLGIGSYNLTSATESSLFAVLRHRTVATSLGVAVAFGTNSSFGGQSLERGRTSGKRGYVVGRNTPSGNEQTLAGSDITTLRIVQGNVYSGTTLEGFVNNVSDGTASFTGPLNSGSGFILGRYFATGFPANVDVCEVVHYNRALTSGERASLHAYFVAKWSIT